MLTYRLLLLIVTGSHTQTVYVACIGASTVGVFREKAEARLSLSAGKNILPAPLHKRKVESSENGQGQEKIKNRRLDPK
jgi:hypothetical protein